MFFQIKLIYGDWTFRKSLFFSKQDYYCKICTNKALKIKHFQWPAVKLISYCRVQSLLLYNEGLTMMKGKESFF